MRMGTPHVFLEEAFDLCNRNLVPSFLIECAKYLLFDYASDLGDAKATDRLREFILS